ncbi:hypothetical protein ACGFSI_33360 [Streptomyces virginiae]|uniref:hypothetical protein n=1 Tax=Streptomyces virginiae TaxID=1961 RepID=UPI0037235B43
MLVQCARSFRSRRAGIDRGEAVEAPDHHRRRIAQRIARPQPTDPADALRESAAQEPDPVQTLLLLPLLGFVVVLADTAGEVSAPVLSAGRSEAYEDGRHGPVHCTPPAHAETNALGAARKAWDLGAATLRSTHEPCAMCEAAARFAGVRQVRYLAPDPWAPAGGWLPVGNGKAGLQRSVAADCRLPTADPDCRLSAADAMFLRDGVLGPAAPGPGQPRSLAVHHDAEPETRGPARPDPVPAGRPTAPSTETWLEPRRPDPVRAASACSCAWPRSFDCAPAPAGAAVGGGR